MSTEQNDFQGGHAPLTPPPAYDPHAARAPQGAHDVPATGGASAPAPDGSQPVGRTSGAKTIIVVTAVVGGVALLGSGGTAAVAAAGDLSRSDSVQTVDVAGIEAIDVDVDGSDMRVEFGDVDEAQLAITHGRGTAWTLERDGDELIVRSPDSPFDWWFGNWFYEEGDVVLTLPEDLRGETLDADLTLDAGSLDVDGDFGRLAIDVSAGALDVEGSATLLDAGMSAGRADIVLDEVTEADFGVSAGNLTVELTGSAPDTTTVDVSAGSVDLTLPDAEYSITQDVSAGSLDARVDQSSSARRVIDVTLSAGSVTIRPGG